MAEETISTRIVANADFSNLIADVHKVTSSLSKLQEQLANSNRMLANQIATMNRSFSDTLRSTGQFSTHFVSLQSDVEKFGKNLDGGKLKLNQYFNTFRDHAKTSGGLIRELAKQQVALQNAILQPLGRNAQGLMQFNVQVPRGLDEVKNKTALAKQELQIYNKVIQDGAGQLINWGKNTQWAGRQLTVGLTVPLAAFGKAAADAFRLADQELTRLTKVYGDIAGTSSTELGNIRKEVSATAKELSQAMGVNFRETIGLAADIAATGKTGNELLSSISETTRLAVLGEVDRQEAMKATLAIQSAFKQNTEELADSINFLNAVENQTSTTLNDLVEAIPKAGPVIQGLGGNVQDLALYLTAMREGGINASEGANALKSALASLINPTDVAVGKFKDFGIDLLGIVNNNAGNVTDTLFALQAALDQLDPLKKQQAIEQLFGKFQFSRLNALFENLGRQGSQTLQVLDLMKASSSELASVADRELKAVTESASGRYRRAVEGLRADLAGIGEEFLKISTGLITIVDKALEFVNKLPGPIKQALTFLGGLTAIAGPFIMLTGVLANFFGYILKGIGHMKAFFRGGEGWKYLTPEMLAAEKAGKLVEQTFYSDAKAASVLQLALKGLIDEFTILQGKASQSVVGVGPAVSTMAGNVVGATAPRIVDPNHPLVGKPFSRASTHMVPRGSMTEEQKMQQTIFGLVPGSEAVNQRIGQNPQIYMNEPLPNIPGLTTIGGTSTGVVANEAAKWHAMMATLAMQSKQEINDLRAQIIATGTVSKDFMGTFDDIFPIISNITDNAAKESAAIVAELRAGKLTLEQAKTKIIALNLEIEKMITSAVGVQAAGMGRVISPTTVPTLNQPVVDPTGRSNMRELFKKSKTKTFIDRVAGILGVRTSGAGYNIETTRPKKFNSGGYVYMSSGATVPGPNVNADVVPAMLTPGEFVVNRESAQANLPLLEAINNGYHEGGSVVRHKHPHKNRVRAHVSLASTMSAGQAAQVHSEYVNDSFKAFADLYPDELVSVKSNKFVRLLPEENDALKMGEGGKRGAGLTKQQLYAAVAGTPASELFSDYGDLDAGTKNVLKSELEKQILRLPAKDKYFDDSLARAFAGAESEVRKLLPNKQRAAFASSMAGRDKARWITHQGFDNIAPPISDRIGGGKPMGASEARKLAGNITSPTFYTSTSGKVAVLMPGGRKGSHAREAGSSMQLSSKLWKAVKTVASRGRAKNAGGMIYMNSGGRVPGMRYYNEGAEVSPLRAGIQSQIGTKGNRRFFGSGLFNPDNTGMRGMATGMGMQIGGSLIGGQVGTAIQFASIIPMLAPNILAKTFNGIKGIATGLGETGKAANLTGKAIGFAFRPLPILAVAGAIAGVAFWIKKTREEAEQRRKEEVMSVGITKKAAEEAKLKNINLSDSIKKVTESLKLQRAAGLAAYEAYTQSGIPQLTLTIKELKAAQKDAKENMKETVDVFSNADPSEVIDLAKNLKAEYIAGGMSVEEATNKIYAIISVSKNANKSIAAIANEGFVAIKDAASAADLKIKSVAASLNTVDPEGLASGLDSMVTLLDISMDKLIGTKDKFNNVIDAGKALEMQFKRIEESGGVNPIGEQAMQGLLKIRPELEGIINSGDSLSGIYAKWRIQLSGVLVDLKNMTSEQAKSLALFQSALQVSIDQAAQSKNGGIMGASEAALKKLNTTVKKNSVDSQKAFEDSQKRQQKELDLITEKIKKINEEAEARKKAISEQQQTEDTKLEIQKAQLDYQNKVAAGDMAGAAQAQLRIKQLVNEREAQKAIDSIEENRAKRVKVEEDKAKRIEDAMKKKQDANANVVANASRAAEQRSTVQDLQAKYEALLIRQNNIEFIKDKAAKETERQAISGGINQLARDIALEGQGNTQFSKILADAFPGLVALNEKSKKLEAKDTGQELMPKVIGGKAVPQFGLSGAESTFAADAAKIKSAAEAAYSKLGGGKTLRDLYDAILTGKPGQTNKEVSASELASLAKLRGYTKPLFKTSGEGRGDLEDIPRQMIIREFGLKKDDTFEYNGVKYRVTGTGSTPWNSIGASRVTKRATFGRVVPGRGYMVGERGPEFFRTDFPGNIQPYYNLRDNAKMNTMFQKGSTSIQGGNNNQVFNFYFEEAPKNAKELYTEFKKLVRTEMVKSGNAVVYGGRY